jgi:hypothetical protein
MLPGSLQFTSHNRLLYMYFSLWCHDGIYYCNKDVYTVDPDPVQLTSKKSLIPQPPTAARCPDPKFLPTTKARQVESKVWALRFGSPGEYQLDLIPRHVKVTQ